MGRAWGEGEGGWAATRRSVGKHRKQQQQAAAGGNKLTHHAVEVSLQQVGAEGGGGVEGGRGRASLLAHQPAAARSLWSPRQGLNPPNLQRSTHPNSSPKKNEEPTGWMDSMSKSAPARQVGGGGARGRQSRKLARLFRDRVAQPTSEVARVSALVDDGEGDDAVGVLQQHRPGRGGAGGGVWSGTAACAAGGAWGARCSAHARPTHLSMRTVCALKSGRT